MDYTVHEILQARTLESAAIPFSRASSQPRDRTQVFHIAGRFSTVWATRELRHISVWDIYQLKEEKKGVYDGTLDLLHTLSVISYSLWLFLAFEFCMHLLSKMKVLSTLRIQWPQEKKKNKHVSKAHSYHHTQQRRETISSKMQHKAGRPPLTTSVQHSTGNPSQSSYARKRNRPHPRWKGRSEIVTYCRWHDCISRNP